MVKQNLQNLLQHLVHIPQLAIALLRSFQRIKKKI